MTKDKFISCSKNKTGLISKLTEELQAANILTVCCRDDADTHIVRECLKQYLFGTVEVRAEDADTLIMLIHHFNHETNSLITVTTSNGSYCIK